MGEEERQADPPAAAPSPAETFEPAEPVQPVEPSGLTPDYDEAGRPSFDYVRDRIEGRYATSLGEEELAGETSQAKALQEQLDEREKAAKGKLDKIRESLRDGSDS